MNIFGRFSHRIGKKLLDNTVEPESNSVAVDFLLKKEVYERLADYYRCTSRTPGQAALSLIEKGMNNYWLMHYKILRDELVHINKTYVEYKRDNALLNDLEKQNEQLRENLTRKNVKIGFK